MADVRIETPASTFRLINPKSVRIEYEYERLGINGQNDHAEYSYYLRTIDEYNRPIPGTLHLEFISNVVYGHGSNSHGWRVAWKFYYIDGSPGIFYVGVGYAMSGEEARQEAFRELARKLIIYANKDGNA